MSNVFPVFLINIIYININLCNVLINLLKNIYIDKKKVIYGMLHKRGVFEDKCVDRQTDGWKDRKHDIEIGR